MAKSAGLTAEKPGAEPRPLLWEYHLTAAGLALLCTMGRCHLTPWGSGRTERGNAYPRLVSRLARGKLTNGTGDYLRGSLTTANATHIPSPRTAWSQPPPHSL